MVEDIISKELLSEVLGVKISSKYGVIGKDVKDNRFYYLLEGYKHIHSDAQEINIHELAYKCKEWAWEQGYVINSHYAKDDCYARANNMVEFSIESKEKTEPEAVFKACQWILENKDK